MVFRGTCANIVDLIRLVWCPGPHDKFDRFAVVDHDGDPLVLGTLAGAADLPALAERQQVRQNYATARPTWRCTAEYHSRHPQQYHH